MKVSAIVVNRDGGPLLRAAVESLLGQDVAGGLEVIVVDNGSTDGSHEVVEARFAGRVTVVRNGENLGFGAANNVGIRASRGEFVLLLNNDAEAAPGCVAALVRAAADPRVGMVAPKVLDHATRRRIDTVGHLVFPDGLNRGRGRLEPDTGQYDGCRTALFPSGAAALFRRATLDDVGLFDESFFLYGEDADLGLRARRAGWECAFAPDAVAYHHYSRTAGAHSSLKAFHVERNRVWVLVKLFPWTAVLLSPAWTAARLALQAWGALTGRGAAARLRETTSALHLVTVTLRAWAAALAGLPRVLRARRAVRDRIGGAAFRRLLAEHRLPLRELALKD